jgi:wyosine [tRNA(Phe)-imidazoG37] synthetase (radical SAM superfamily)
MPSASFSGLWKKRVILSLEGEPTHMANLSGIVNQLKKERDRVEKQLLGLNAALSAFAGV